MADFDQAFQFLIGLEGQDLVPDDTGAGPSKYGITQETLKALGWRTTDPAQLTINDAREIYRKHYWDKLGLDSLQDQRLAQLLFATVVNTGESQALDLLAESLGSNEPLNVPGIINYLNKADDQTKIQFASRYLQKLNSFYQNLANKDPQRYSRYLPGWIMRVGRLAKLFPQPGEEPLLTRIAQAKPQPEAQQVQNVYGLPLPKPQQEEKPVVPGFVKPVTGPQQQLKSTPLSLAQDTAELSQEALGKIRQMMSAGVSPADILDNISTAWGMLDEANLDRDPGTQGVIKELIVSLTRSALDKDPEYNELEAQSRLLGQVAQNTLARMQQLESSYPVPQFAPGLTGFMQRFHLALILEDRGMEPLPIYLQKLYEAREKEKLNNLRVMATLNNSLANLIGKKTAVSREIMGNHQRFSALLLDALKAKHNMWVQQKTVRLREISARLDAIRTQMMAGNLQREWLDTYRNLARESVEITNDLLERMGSPEKVAGLLTAMEVSEIAAQSGRDIAEISSQTYADIYRKYYRQLILGPELDLLAMKMPLQRPISKIISTNVITGGGEVRKVNQIVTFYPKPDGTFHVTKSYDTSGVIKELSDEQVEAYNNAQKVREQTSAILADYMTLAMQKGLESLGQRLKVELLETIFGQDAEAKRILAQLNALNEILVQQTTKSFQGARPSDRDLEVIRSAVGINMTDHPAFNIAKIAYLNAITEMNRLLIASQVTLNGQPISFTDDADVVEDIRNALQGWVSGMVRRYQNLSQMFKTVGPEDREKVMKAIQRAAGSLDMRTIIIDALKKNGYTVDESVGPYAIIASKQGGFRHRKADLYVDLGQGMKITNQEEFLKWLESH